MVKEYATTVRGKALADKVGRYLGFTNEITSLCSGITRNARAYNTIQEAWCCVEMSARQTRRTEAREAALEARIADLVGSLPATDDGPFTVRFQGDPRGWTVRLIHPDGKEIGCDD